MNKKIGLIDIDSKIPNLALMKISTYHKSKGDQVEWWLGNVFHSQYDKVYASKVFTFPKLSSSFPKNIEIGGSGYDLNKKLPDKIEYLRPDYSIYPECDYSIGFITRGCHRKCKFCKVPEKEGNIKYNQHWGEFCNLQKGKYWVFLDNNILAYNKHEQILGEIIERKMKIDFNQATDIRLVNESNAELLAKIKWNTFYRFSFDWINLENIIKEKVTLLVKNGLKAYKMFCFVLIGYNTTEEQDIYRVEMLRDLKVNPFVMPYNKFDLYQKRFARWVNHKAIFKSVKWKDYNNKKISKFKNFKSNGFGFL